ncbi:Oligosaccaryltransferase-domain-containing protein [Lasiosphaeris hirsuta]|uniref:Dolichyl-diphosphooligosaccharide--protein glycosyltransferase subunit 4 n=1 Tax=Lasiosphaeris hirsuta TaxID=260670 RepID=A0AA39ZX96_9PEZI|nr:Oligosaccaryltransferase-domain-containing protein [Lasiosphaeris hirsuta]
MISDDELYRLAISLGSVAMVLIVLYHYFEVNADNQKERRFEDLYDQNGHFNSLVEELDLNIESNAVTPERCMAMVEVTC